MQKHIIKLSKPAENWEHASPIGGGSFGAMLFGSTDTEKIYLCEESIWSGEERDTTIKDFKERVDSIRKMYLEGRIPEIDPWAEKYLGEGIETIKSYEYAGLLTIDFDDKTPAENYRRCLHLNSGIAEISYTKNGNNIKETAFCSYADETTAIKIEAEKEIGFTLVFSRENTESVTFLNDLLLVRAKTSCGKHRFAVGIKIETDGDITYKDGKVTINDSVDTVLFIAVATEFNFSSDFEAVCLDILSEAEDFEEMKEASSADFSSLFERSDIEFTENEEIASLFTDERLERLKNDENAEDDGLIALYFAFGKYLLISSSRDGTLPANLQGVWVEKLQNPWNSDYHTNINLQMNYWLPEVANISECHLPLFDYMNNFLLESGKKTAKENYHCRGTVLHHLSDIYGFTTPADGIWGVWPMGGAWLSFHLWEHYLYTKDVDFLKETAYDYLHECALFFMDFMFEGPDGYLLSGPSMSPENDYYPIEGNTDITATIAFSPTMDIEIIGGTLRNYIDMENILGVNPEDKKKAEETLKKLPPLKVGKNGCLQEWLEDYGEPEPGHRHISHAFGLYPDNMITEATPEFFDAIRKTLDRRLSFGGGHTGWSRAWLINLFARLKDGKNTYEHIRLLLTKSTLGNLFDIHPPFQIDGNFGGAAGIAESLLQSHEGYISILPAAKEGLSGSFTSLKARGNVDVSAEFSQGKVTKVVLYAPENITVKVKANGNMYEVQLKEDNEAVITI
ncbi:MAG: glycoside hydrolase family 95 protein [Ruminococcaceae bacterium]|nr:glycoside hydrolase family 95 protein [Oscillospiraceae bacterium]